MKELLRREEREYGLGNSELEGSYYEFVLILDKGINTCCKYAGLSQRALARNNLLRIIRNAKHLANLKSAINSYKNNDAWDEIAICYSDY